MGTVDRQTRSARCKAKVGPEARHADQALRFPIFIVQRLVDADRRSQVAQTVSPTLSLRAYVMSQLAMPGQGSQQ